MDASPRVWVEDAVPPEIVVHDAPGPCAYLPDRLWRLPLRLPVRPLSRRELDERLTAGDRRQGRLLYRASCPECQACVPLRVDVACFEPSRTQRRVFARGERLIRVEHGRLGVSAERVELYNRHKAARGLGTGNDETGAEVYGLVLADSCCDSFEMRYFLGEELLGVAVVDRAERALSAVYCYYDPAHARLSPGTYSILKQIDLARSWGMRHLYLGLYIAECRPMAYKARFFPHEQLHDGVWIRVERPPR